MNSPFFITGLPRTRSAWLANLFTTDRTLCFHDPVGTVSPLQAANSGKRLGVSSPLLAPVFGELLKSYPDARWLYIERDPVYSKLSLKVWAAPKMRLPPERVDEIYHQLLSASTAVKSHHGTLVVRYDGINDQLPEIWRHIMGDVEFPAQRVEILKRLKIEQHLNLAWLERGMA